MNKPAAIYARVSSDRQKENHTIASQTAAPIEYAQKNGYTVPPKGLPLCHVLLASPVPLGDLGAWRSERAFWRAAWLLICEERVCRGHLSIDTGPNHTRLGA